MINYMICLTVFKLPVNKTKTNINIDQLIYARCLLNPHKYKITEI